jgi:sugar (pentulose or hexulose) kinase
MKMLAFDLGASSGKMFLGNFNGSKLSLDVIKRFENRPVFLRNEIFWNVLDIYSHLEEGISIALQKDNQIRSIGFDSFSNDFGFLDKDGYFVNQVHCYRDERTYRNADAIYARMSKELMHKRSGNQNALFGTLMQLATMRLEKQSYLLEGSGKMLFLPDLFSYFLTGEVNSEYTISSVSQMLDFEKGDWSAEILDTFQIPMTLMADIVLPGTRVGMVNHTPIEVVAVCEHDTASAFLSAPMGEDAVIISSGTWSLVGVETLDPIISDYTFKHNIANEGGYPGHHRLLKNVMGLWLIQECQRAYAEIGQDYSIETLLGMATDEKAFQCMIYPDDERFFYPGNMPEKIREFCSQKGQLIPSTPGQIVRCVLESLALQYRFVIEELKQLTDRSYGSINIVGGGSPNALLNQFVANVSGKPVIAGPGEATAIGNILVQLISSGELGSVKEGRMMLKDSVGMKYFEPENQNAWNTRFEEYLQMIGEQEI